MPSLISVDANLLIYAHDQASPHHERARDWWRETVNGNETVGLGYPAVTAFIRIATHPGLKRPRSIEEVVDIVGEWLNRPSVILLTPGSRHWAILRDILVNGQATGGLAIDAHLAALAVEHGATFCTNDKGFRRFPKVKLRYPLDE